MYRYEHFMFYFCSFCYWFSDMRSGRVGEAVCEAGQCKALRRRAVVEQEHGDLAFQAAPDGLQRKRAAHRRLYMTEYSFTIELGTCWGSWHFAPWCHFRSSSSVPKFVIGNESLQWSWSLEIGNANLWCSCEGNIVRLGSVRHCVVKPWPRLARVDNDLASFKAKLAQSSMTAKQLQQISRPPYHRTLLRHLSIVQNLHGSSDQASLKSAVLRTPFPLVARSFSKVMCISQHAEASSPLSR